MYVLLCLLCVHAGGICSLFGRMGIALYCWAVSGYVVECTSGCTVFMKLWDSNAFLPNPLGDDEDDELGVHIYVGLCIMSYDSAKLWMLVGCDWLPPVPPAAAIAAWARRRHTRFMAELMTVAAHMEAGTVGAHGADVSKKPVLDCPWCTALVQKSGDNVLGPMAGESLSHVPRVVPAGQSFSACGPFFCAGWPSRLTRCSACLLCHLVEHRL